MGGIDPGAFAHGGDRIALLACHSPCRYRESDLAHSAFLRSDHSAGSAGPPGAPLFGERLLDLQEVACACLRRQFSCLRSWHRRVRLHLVGQVKDAIVGPSSPVRAVFLADRHRRRAPPGCPGLPPRPPWPGRSASPAANTPGSEVIIVRPRPARALDHRPRVPGRSRQAHWPIAGITTSTSRSNSAPGCGAPACAGRSRRTRPRPGARTFILSTRPFPMMALGLARKCRRTPSASAASTLLGERRHLLAGAPGRPDAPRTRPGGRGARGIDGGIASAHHRHAAARGGLPKATSRRKPVAEITPSRSSPGTTQAPVALVRANRKHDRVASVALHQLLQREVAARRELSRISTPARLMCSISARRTSLGRR